MHVVTTVIGKRPEITNERFRHFSEHDRGLPSAAVAQGRTFELLHIEGMTTDGAAPPLDAIARNVFHGH